MKMQVNGLSAEINTPIAPEGEGTHALPPCDRQKVYNVDEYKACPDNWMHGSAKVSSYFMPLRPGRHLWIDLNGNLRHRKHVAAVLSIQGINPITGQRTKSLDLEQYSEKCPVHNIEFGGERYCEECGYKWPAQNYMTTASTPRGLFWIDGFRAEDGTIHGFLITEETARGVAAQIIGEDRVFAIGIAFYLSKEEKPRPQNVMRSMGMTGQSALPEMTGGSWANCATRKSRTQENLMTQLVFKEMDMAADNMTYGSASLSSTQPRSRSMFSEPVETKKLEIGAGAKINQELSYPDSNSLDYYEDEPAGMIYVNYCSVEDCNKIIESGKKDLTKGGEGFLAELNKGN